jgi:hypothetical protein
VLKITKNDKKRNIQDDKRVLTLETQRFSNRSRNLK